MGKLIILTGAPESDRLDWTSPDLLQTFLDPIARFAHLQPQAEALIPPIPTEHQHRHYKHDKSNLDLAVWRSLPLQRTHVPTGFSQQHDLNLVGHFPSSADFLTTAGISFEAASQGLSQEDAEEESSRLLGEFYEHSFAVHHNLPSSQLVPHSQSQGQGKGLGGARVGAEAGAGAESHAGSGVGANATSFSSGEQQEEDSATILAGDTTMAVKAPFRPGVRGLEDHLSDLEDIPPASYILSTMPQTITVTLIVGIISIAAPRTVETRYGTAQTLVEVLVGDETKSGFSVTFWLSGADGGPGGGVLAGLRGQDVVLMQNVALNVFRGKVYGGSLRKGMTKVFLLYRGRRVDGEDESGYYSASDLEKAGRKAIQQHPQLEKTRRTRDWVLNFVGGGPGVVDPGVRTTRMRKGKGRAPRRDWNQPPPLDTQ